VVGWGSLDSPATRADVGGGLQCPLGAETSVLVIWQPRPWRCGSCGGGLFQGGASPLFWSQLQVLLDGQPYALGRLGWQCVVLPCRAAAKRALDPTAGLRHSTFRPGSINHACIAMVDQVALGHRELRPRRRETHRCPQRIDLSPFPRRDRPTCPRRLAWSSRWGAGLVRKACHGWTVPRSAITAPVRCWW